MLEEIRQFKAKRAGEQFRLIKGDDGYERVVYSEMLIPETLNAFNDYYTRHSIREFAYAYMVRGFGSTLAGGVGIDLEHDEVDVTGQVYVVESFIAREGDPDFIEGSWVVGMYVQDDDIWEQIKNHELNGFSYQAMVNFFEVEVDLPHVQMVTGTTEPDPSDGHTHDFFVLLDGEGKIVGGGTTDTNGHHHPIRRHTFTTEAEGHVHIFNYIQ